MVEPFDNVITLVSNNNSGTFVGFVNNDIFGFYIVSRGLIFVTWTS